jgi:hypothetical protein
MNTVMLALAVVATSANPCATRFCTPAYKAHNVVAIQQIYVPHGYLYGPVGYHPQQHKTQDELTAAALLELNQTIREAQGLPANALAATSIDLAKCTRCHSEQSSNEVAKSHYIFPPNPTLQDAAIAAKVLRGLRHGMDGAEYANIPSEKVQTWLDAAMDSVDAHFDKGE